MSRCACWLQAWLLVVPGACFGQIAQSRPAVPVVPRVELVGSQAVPDVGAGQGVIMHAGFVYLYADRDTGIIREYRMGTGATPELVWTQREMRLTQNGQDLVPHPTGLAFHADSPTFLGNTVSGKGTIFCIDWQRLLADGNLDHAVLATIDDDLATNGTRPEYVLRNGRWLIATADYGDKKNEIRYYDPQRLAQAKRTSEPGVLVEHQTCGAWVQGLCWLGDAGVLMMIQNQTEGRGWRLTFLPFTEPSTAWSAGMQQDFQIRGELEGFCTLEGDRCLFLQSSRRENVWFGRLAWQPAPTATQSAPASAPAR